MCWIDSSIDTDYWSPTIPSKEMHPLYRLISYIIFIQIICVAWFVIAAVFTWVPSISSDNHHCSNIYNDRTLLWPSYQPNRIEKKRFYNHIFFIISSSYFFSLLYIVYDIKLDWSINKSHIINKNQSSIEFFPPWNLERLLMTLTRAEYFIGRAHASDITMYWRS